jgi:hypothetical protein
VTEIDRNTLRAMGDQLHHKLFAISSNRAIEAGRDLFNVPEGADALFAVATWCVMLCESYKGAYKNTSGRAVRFKLKIMD